MWYLHPVEIAFDLGNATAGCDGLQGVERVSVAATYRMRTCWPPHPRPSAQGTPSTPSGRLRDEAKAYLQALEVGLREAPATPKGKYAREKEPDGFLGDTRVFPPCAMAGGPVLQKACTWWPERARAKPQGRHC